MNLSMDMEKAKKKKEKAFFKTGIFCWHSKASQMTESNNMNGYEKNRISGSDHSLIQLLVSTAILTSPSDYFPNRCYGWCCLI